MKVIVFGATGMVGQGVLRECLRQPEVEAVLTVGRTKTGMTNNKLKELAHTELGNYDAIESELNGYDAAFFCLGISSAGMKEKDYHHVTYDFTIAAARTLAKLNPDMTFIYVTGQGTDSSEKGRVMWARVKGKTENELQRIFKKAYLLRPGAIQPLNGEKSKTRVYRISYWLLAPLLPTIKKLFPAILLTTEQMGQAMIQLTKKGYSKNILEIQDIAEVARR